LLRTCKKRRHSNSKEGNATVNLCQSMLCNSSIAWPRKKHE
jgi:hypothetical protein